MRITYFTERKTFIMKFICPPNPIGRRGTLKFESSKIMNLCVEVGYCTEYGEVIYDATKDELHSY